MMNWQLYGQKNIDNLMEKYRFETPYISVDALQKTQSTTVILDAREVDEFRVSHIKNAHYIGYKNFDLKQLNNIVKDKNTTIVVYCSVGVRSGNIGDQLKARGYTSVYNLYGGIFEWVNNGFAVYDLNKNITKQIHAYSKKWGVYLKKGVKIYE